jgi:class 3 adenylate cyclase
VTRWLSWGVLVALPVAGLALLLAVPRLDAHWEHHPAHFWLVALTGAVNFALGFLMGEAAWRRRDARVFLVSLAFLSSAGFLVLHALATPGVLLAGKNAGFQIAAPIGLLLAGVFAALSSLEWSGDVSSALVRNRRVLHAGLLVLMGTWAAVSLTTLPPLDDPIPPEEVRGPLIALAVAGGLLYAFASVRYAALYRRRPSPLLLAVVASFFLLAEAMVAVALARNWHATWWEWHLLMLVAFAVVARSAWQEWKVEGSPAEIWSDIYQERTRGHSEELSVLFADLQGFTSYSERTPEDEIKAMLDEYWRAAAPVAEAHDGWIDKTIGDALMVVFRDEGHALRAARAGLAFQEETGRIAAAHPAWPRFRTGINSGAAIVGLPEARGARRLTVTGDTVNVAARLEGHARAGEVVIGETTRAALGSLAQAEALGELPIKGKARPVRAFLLRALASERDERDQRLQHEENKAEP